MVESVNFVEVHKTTIYIKGILGAHFFVPIQASLIGKASITERTDVWFDFHVNRIDVTSKYSFCDACFRTNRTNRSNGVCHQSFHIVTYFHQGLRVMQACSNKNKIHVVTRDKQILGEGQGLPQRLILHNITYFTTSFNLFPL